MLVGGFGVSPWVGVTEAEMNFIFGYFNMIELPFVNFPHTA